MSKFIHKPRPIYRTHDNEPFEPLPKHNFNQFLQACISRVKREQSTFEWNQIDSLKELPQTRIKFKKT